MLDLLRPTAGRARIFGLDSRVNGRAARALVGYGFSVLGAHRVVANCDPRNEASWRTLERIGLKREGHFRKHAFFRTDADGNPLWHDCLSYGILEEDWKR